MFHARWWDYTRRKFNLNGRICAETMIPFGLLSCLVIYVVNPVISSFILGFNINILRIMAVILLILYLLDTYVSTGIMFNFKDTLKTLEKDGTEEITKRVREVLHNRSYLYKRLVDAFPTLLINKERLLLLQEQIKNELNKYLKR